MAFFIRHLGTSSWIWQLSRWEISIAKFNLKLLNAECDFIELENPPNFLVSKCVSTVENLSAVSFIF